jgi:ABC-type multidrug transport system ATPase subunit
MTDSGMAIQVRGLSKTFGLRCALSEVTFDVAAGESIAITGANGAGKSTLLRCMASVARPTAGDVYWFGRPAARDVAARRLIGMVAHESRLYPHLTLRENLLFAARMYDVPEPRRRAAHLWQELGLEAHLERTPTEISRGMRQRLALARALVHTPQILFLDEPFASLDAEGTQWLHRFLGAFRAEGRTICFCEHDVGHVHRLADRVLELRSGRAWEVRGGVPAPSSQSPLEMRAA